MINRRLRLTLLLCFCGVLSSPLFAASDATAPISLNDRVYLASRIYGSLANFAHFQGVPDLDVDGAYRVYLDKVIAGTTRKDFTLASMHFLARMQNGHTVLFDRILMEQAGPLPFVARTVEGKWVITQSPSPDLKPGDVIEKINGAPFEQFYSQVRPYISASSEYAARNMLFSQLGDFVPFALLFPEKFDLTLSGSRTVTIDRHVLPKSAAMKTDGRWLEPGKLAYIRIPSFFYPDNEKRALELVREFQQAPALVIDVRGNAGGSTPSDLTSLLMDRPYRFWTESTPIDMPYFRFRAIQGDWHYGPFRQPQMLWQNPATAPAKDAFKGKLVVLVDGGCYSSCEDFTMPFKDNHRAVIVGQATSGSTGQPYVTDLGDGMLLLVGAKRAYFPDGMPFEGVGIKPDIEVAPTVQDLANGRDVVLEAARRNLAQ